MHTTSAELVDVAAPVALRTYLAELWARRSYVWYVAVNELRSRQVTTVLGNVWHLLNPALTIGVFYLIFGVLLKTNRGVDNFILFLALGLFSFQFTQRATMAGSTSIVSNQGLVRALRFPRAILTLTSTVVEALATIPTLGVILLVAVLTGEPPTWRWFLLPLPFVVQFVFNLGAAFVAARLTTHFRDTTQILPFVFRLLLYASGVIFNVSSYVSSESAARWLFVANPAYCFIEMTRWCMLDRPLDGDVLWSAGIWTIAVLIIGFLWFRAGEHDYSRD